MKQTGIIILLWLSSLTQAVAQLNAADSLRLLLDKTKEDTNRALLLIELSYTYRLPSPDTCRVLAQQALQLSRQLNFVKGEVKALNTIGESYRLQGEFPRALEPELEALRKSREHGFEEDEATSLVFIGSVYTDVSEYDQGLNYFRQGLAIYETISQTRLIAYSLSSIGNVYEKKNQLDSALFYQKKAFALSKQAHTRSMTSLILTRLGNAYNRLGNYDKAMDSYKLALQNTYLNGDFSNRASSQCRIAEIFNSLNLIDSSLHYALLAFANGRGVAQKRALLDASTLLSELYRSKNNIDSAYYYQGQAFGLKDSLFGAKQFQRLQSLTFSEQQRQQQLQREKDKLQRTYQLILLLSTAAFFLLLALIAWYNNRKKQKVNRVLNAQKEQISVQRNDLEKAIVELKQTQAHLIQSEKMASLGELTAGIAHEIQNPLNFVNNFSEVNKELLTEMNGEIEKGNLGEVKSIAKDIWDNEEKINHHGKRADSIVKGMLQHSRASTGHKDATDINALADEYLRLAYNGIRATDKSFSAAMETDFDSGIGKINIIPQDIGRMLLNLYNNAFYAVNEKKDLATGDYKPTVTVSTKKAEDKIQLRVKDNGNGIPEQFVDKIFQPFFTTKPAGSGTGLGLSLAYDIIKAHGGQISVLSKSGEGTEFVVVLPA